MTTHFLKRIDFMKIFFTSEGKILETTSCQVFTTAEWLQWEWFCFKVSWWFSCQLLRFIDHKSSHFVWSITLRNLNQFQNLVFWNQHEKFYLLMKFEENLRWWGDFFNLFSSFDIEWPSNYRSAWHDVARIKRWVYQWVGSDLVA